TFGGITTAFLITSKVTTGTYVVTATTGGTTSGDYGVLNDSNVPVTLTHLGGQFSTPPISALVAVTCTIANSAPSTTAPAVSPPSATGVITAPNTGDGG